MKKGIRALLMVLVIALLMWLAIDALSPHEPAYAGRSLSSWLKQLDDGDTGLGLPWELWPTNRTANQLRAAEAIRQIGTNGLPYLFDALTNRDHSLKQKVLLTLAKQRWFKLPPPSTNQLHRAAALAFEALGPQAKGAVPGLVKLLNQNPPANGDTGKVTTIALAGIDPEGRAALIPFVHSNGWTATMAIWGLAGNRVVVPPDVIERLIGNVRTNASGCGAISGWALGALRQDAEHAIPALIDGLNSKDTGTRWGSAYGLRLWGTNAVSAIPALTAQLADPDQTIRNYAKTALKEIDPKTAARADEP